MQNNVYHVNNTILLKEIFHCCWSHWKTSGPWVWYQNTIDNMSLKNFPHLDGRRKDSPSPSYRASLSRGSDGSPAAKLCQNTWYVDAEHVTGKQIQHCQEWMRTEWEFPSMATTIGMIMGSQEVIDVSGVEINPAYSKTQCLSVCHDAMRRGPGPSTACYSWNLA